MASTYFKRTGTTTVNTYTFSAWIKLGTLSSANNTYQVLFSSGNQGILAIYGGPTTAGHNALYHYNGSDPIWYTNNLLRDPSAWYHVVAKVSSGTVTTYINGVQTSYATSTYSLGALETTANKTCVGVYAPSTTSFFRGSMANVEFVSGTALGPEYFGSTNSNTGIWTPQASSTISDYGADGFKLKMDTTSPQNDTSGKGNNFTLGGGTPTLLQGSPSNNWCTWNSLVPLTTNYVYSNGNTTVNQTSGAWVKTVATIGVTKGKWYWEVKAVDAQISAGKYTVIGVATTTSNTAPSGMPPNGIGMKSNGTVAISTSTVATLSVFELGDIISCYLDMDNGALYYAKNGAMLNSGVPTSGASKTGAFSLPNPTLPHFASLSPYGTNNKAEANFGEGFFGTVAAGTQADDNGQGLFKYDVPAGYYTLNTKNLEAYG